MKFLTLVFFLLIYQTALGNETLGRLEFGFEDLPRLIKEQNRHIHGAQSMIQAAQTRTGHLARSYLPHLNLQGGYETFNTGPFARTAQPYGAIETEINLFRGGRDALEENTRENQVALSSAQREQVYLNELTEARRTYWNIVYQRLMILIIQDALHQNEDNLAAANRRVGAGISTATDRLEFEMYRIQLQQDLTRLTLEAAGSQRILTALLGLSEGTELNILGGLPHEHDDALLEMTLDANTHRNVKILTANENISLLRKAQAYRWWTPSLDVYGNYSLYTLREREYPLQANRYEAAAGIRLTFKLFDGLQSKAEGVALGWQADAYEAQAQQTARELQAQFQTSKQTLGLTHDLIHSAEESVSKGKQYLSNTLAEYNRGVKNSPDVFGATQKYVELRRRLAELKRDYHMARADLMAAMGR